MIDRSRQEVWTTAERPQPAVSVALLIPAICGNRLLVRVWADYAPSCITDTQGNTFTLVRAPGTVCLAPLPTTTFRHFVLRYMRRVFRLPPAVNPSMWEWQAEVGNSGNNVITVTGRYAIHEVRVFEQPAKEDLTALSP